MTIDITPEQYRTLLKAMYWAGWMKNAMKTEMDEEGEEIRALEQHIYAYTEQFQTLDWVTYEDELKGYYPNYTMETEVHGVIEEFENDCFWEELTYRLARRDVFEKYGPKIGQDPEKLMEKEQPFLEQYAEEFERNGLRNLRVSSE